MIPNSAACAVIFPEGKENRRMETGFLDLTPEMFSFRLPVRFFPEKTFAGSAEIYFLSLKEGGYHRFFLPAFLAKAEKTDAYFTVYRVFPASLEYADAAGKFLREYGDYIRLRSSSEDAEVSEALSGYPAEKEECIAADFLSQQHSWLEESLKKRKSRMGSGKERAEAENSGPECTKADAFAVGIAIDRPELYENFLKEPAEAFAENYFRKNGMENFPKEDKKISFVQFGNPCCSFLSPDRQLLFELKKKAKEEGLSFSLVTGIPTESTVQQMTEDLCRFAEEEGRFAGGEGWFAEEEGRFAGGEGWFAEEEGRFAGGEGWFAEEEGRFAGGEGWSAEEEDRSAGEKGRFGEGKKTELVINDWGLLFSLLNQKADFALTLGPLLLRQRKDTRTAWKLSAFSNEDRSPLLLPEFASYLKDSCRICRIQTEGCTKRSLSCGLPVTITLPFFQMNLSAFCPTAAYVNAADRGAQKKQKSCPGYCRERVFLYPDFLHMMGRGKGLFGYDGRLLEDPESRKCFQREGADRLLFWFP